jgi:hypothetical protein
MALARPHPQPRKPILADGRFVIGCVGLFRFLPLEFCLGDDEGGKSEYCSHYAREAGPCILIGWGCLRYCFEKLNIYAGRQ